MAFRILVASYTNEIYTLDFDSESSSLKLVASSTVGFHPSWLAQHPNDRSLIFAGIEQAAGKVVAVKFTEDGKGEVVGEASSAGEDPCHVLVTSDEVIIANVSLRVLADTLDVSDICTKYSSGSVAFFPLPPADKPVFQSTPSALVQLSGSGPNQARQLSSHAHQAILHPDREELLIPDLGADKVWRFTKAETGKWEIGGHIKYSSGGGPRHVTFYGAYLTFFQLSLTSF